MATVILSEAVVRPGVCSLPSSSASSPRLPLFASFANSSLRSCREAKVALFFHHKLPDNRIPARSTSLTANASVLIRILPPFIYFVTLVSLFSVIIWPLLEFQMFLSKYISLNSAFAKEGFSSSDLYLYAIIFSPRNGVYTVGDFMTKRESLHVVKSTTGVDDALELLVEKRITGFPVIDDDWNLVGVVSDYDLLALDSISGSGGKTETNLFPEVNSSWKTFNKIQRLLSKTNGKVVGDVMTPAPLVVRETTNLEDAARLLLETKYRRLPVVDGNGKLIGMITRGNVVRAALQLKHESENMN